MLQKIRVLSQNAKFDGGTIVPECIPKVEFQRPTKIHLKGRGHPLRLTTDSEVGEVLQVGLDKEKNEVYVMVSLFGAGATFFARRERQAEFSVVGESKASLKRLWYAPWRKKKLIESIRVSAVIMEIKTDEEINERVHSGRANPRRHAKPH